MHGFILLISSIAEWGRGTSVSEGVLSRLENIERIFDEVVQAHPNWDYVQELSRDLPRQDEIIRRLRQDREALSRQPELWEMELREARGLLAFLIGVFQFLHRNPSLKPDFDSYIKRFEKPAP